MKLVDFYIKDRFMNDCTGHECLLVKITAMTILRKKELMVFRDTYMSWRYLDTGEQVPDKLIRDLENRFRVIKFMEYLDAQKQGLE